VHSHPQTLSAVGMLCSGEDSKAPLPSLLLCSLTGIELVVLFPPTPWKGVTAGVHNPPTL
jgi:hypothetical protein